ncbi:MAG: hypothetical protein JXL20_03890 [Deltaproteobacteria bacterium]|nr:hypothetical protein [Deltaproteobacteria bacterium]
MKIDTIKHCSPYLPEIKRLWRKNSQTLGFFPEGAFDEHAIRGSILAAISDSERGIGDVVDKVE